MKRKASEISSIFIPKELKKLKFNEDDGAMLQFKNVFERIEIASDGNCLFRVIQYCLKGKQDGHELLRRAVCQHYEDNGEEYKDLYQPRGKITTFTKYIQILKKDGEWGDSLELTVLANLYGFNAVIYHPNSLSIHTLHLGHGDLRSKPLYHIEYHNYNHFNVLKPRATSQAYIFLHRFVTAQEGEAKRKEVEKINEQEKIMMEITEKQKQIKITLPKRSTRVKTLKEEGKEVMEESKHNEMETSSEGIQSSKKRVIMVKKLQKPDGEEYPQAKKGHNAYNEVYKYLKDKITPTRIKLPKSLKSWKKKWRVDIV